MPPCDPLGPGFYLPFFFYSLWLFRHAFLPRCLYVVAPGHGGGAGGSREAEMTDASAGSVGNPPAPVSPRGPAAQTQTSGPPISLALGSVAPNGGPATAQQPAASPPGSSDAAPAPGHTNGPTSGSMSPLQQAFQMPGAGPAAGSIVAAAVAVGSTAGSAGVATRGATGRRGAGVRPAAALAGLSPGAAPFCPEAGASGSYTFTASPAGDTSATGRRKRFRQDDGTPASPPPARTTKAQLAAHNALLTTITQLTGQIARLAERITALEQNRDFGRQASVDVLKRCFMVFLPKNATGEATQAFGTITSAHITAAAELPEGALSVVGRGRTWLRVQCESLDTKHLVMKATMRQHFRASFGVVVADDLTQEERTQQKFLLSAMKWLYSANFKPSWRRARIFIRRQEATAILSVEDFHSLTTGTQYTKAMVLDMANAKLRRSNDRRPGAAGSSPPPPAPVTSGRGGTRSSSQGRPACCGLGA